MSEQTFVHQESKEKVVVTSAQQADALRRHGFELEAEPKKTTPKTKSKGKKSRSKRSTKTQ